MWEKFYGLKWRRYHPQAFARFDELLQNERMPIGELMKLQETARQKIVRRAKERTAFDRKFYGDAGLGQRGQVSTVLLEV